MRMWIIFVCLSNGWMLTPSNAGVTPTPTSAQVVPTEDESSQLVVKSKHQLLRHAKYEMH